MYKRDRQERHGGQEDMRKKTMTTGEKRKRNSENTGKEGKQTMVKRRGEDRRKTGQIRT
jgi:hypothetical protein